MAGQCLADEMTGQGAIDDIRVQLRCTFSAATIQQLECELI
jgi:hypothetical protein